MRNLFRVSLLLPVPAVRLIGYVSAMPSVFARYEFAPAKLRRALNINTGYPEPGAMVAGPVNIAPATMIFSHDGRTLAAYSEPNTLALWDAAFSCAVLADK